MMQIKSDQSLSEVHGSVDTTVNSGKPLWRRALAFFGPAYLVSVGYMDPGNWASDLAGGSQFGYKLVWVLLMSNGMALLLQSLAARLGIVRGRDLAQANRETYPRWLNIILYGLAEIAIASTDLAEVLGMAIGIQLLTGMPLLWAVLITLADTFLLLLLQRFGMRKMEAFIIGLIAIIGISFLAQLVLAKPHLGEVVKGIVPTIPSSAALFIITSIIGATVMPHNLYLHSALVQTRKIRRDESGIRRAIKLNFIDSAIALNAAFFVNAAILVLAASVFYFNGRTDIAGIREAHQLLEGMLGTKLAPVLFAVALIAAGQSSTITGTLAGQIVMEGYLHIRIDPWVRRLLTRLLAIVPAVIVIMVYGEKNVDSLLLLSQVVLSLQLGFAIIPLIHFVSDRKSMGVFAINTTVKSLAWAITAILLYLNGRMVIEQLVSYFNAGNSVAVMILLSGLAFTFGLLLVVVTIFPLLKRPAKALPAPRPIHHEAGSIGLPIIPAYHSIALALDFSRFDDILLAHALGHAGQGTRFVLIHVVESASARIHGSESDDLETRNDLERLEGYAGQLRTRGFEATTFLGYHSRAKEIVRLVKESGADLLIIGAHGHRGMLDWIYGQTIDSVRHNLKIPVLIVSTE
jgi:manganese transport protein